MIKKFLLLLLILAVPVTCMALGVLDDGTYVGEVTDINFTGTTVSYDGSRATVPTAEATIERAIKFYPGEFVTEDAAGGGVQAVNKGSAPGLEEDNNIPACVWADGETTRIQVTFKVPADYSSGGAFRAFCGTSTTAPADTPVSVDFGLWINSEGAAWDATQGNQDTVELGTTPDLVVLTPSTDSAAIVAAAVVTLDLWRDNAASPVNATGDLEVYYVEFFYTASQ